jgi:sugar lactone lactonase YvrE
LAIGPQLGKLPHVVALLVPCFLFAQDFSEIRVEKVSAGHGFTEGPAWSQDGALVFSDIPNDRILKMTPGERPFVFRKDANGPNGNAFDALGRMYTCESRTRRVTRTDRKGHVEVLADKYQGKRFNAPNDIVVRKDGHVWFTDPAFGNQQDTRELDFYGVFHVPLKGELEVIARTPGRPNGVALSPDGHILYVAGSDEQNVRAFDLDKHGAASNERVLISGIPGVPDGLRTDEHGNLYLAARSIFVYSPSGKQLHEIPMSETPSNCAFGDADLQGLYVTARSSVYRIRLNVKGSVQY